MSSQLQPDSTDLNSNSNKTVSKSCDREHEIVDAETGETEAELEDLGTQIGGHSSRIEKYKKTKLGIYDLKNGLILKTLFPPPRGPRELKFYQQVFSPECGDAGLLELRPFIPTFHGVEEKLNTTMMKLSNLTWGFHKPCVMDVKMGRITYDQDATSDKIHYEEIKFPPLKKTGFQITGMIIQNQTEKKAIDKHYTRCLTEKTLVTEGLDIFFSILDDKARNQVIHGLVSRLKNLETWFSKQKKLSFTASSLLFIYEGENCKGAIRPLVKKNSELAIKNNQTSSLTDMQAHSESNNHSSVSTTAPRKRSHDNTSDNEDGNCDGPGNKILKDTSLTTDTTHSKVIHGDSSHKTRESATPVLKHEVKHSTADSSCQANSNESIPGYSVHLIDFAHVFPASDVDENVLFGLRNLISSLLSLTE